MNRYLNDSISLARTLMVWTLLYVVATFGAVDMILNG
jgi:hypothetical protein